MDLFVSDFKKDIQTLRRFQRETKFDIFRIQAEPFLQNIQSFRERFAQYHVEETPKLALSKYYKCTGRLKFYKGAKDNDLTQYMLHIYLDFEEKTDYNGIKLLNSLMWPVLCKWKVELIDDNDRDNVKTLLMGEASSLFNRPRNALKSHPNDWISINLARIEGSGLISLDGSVTLRWTVQTDPFLHAAYGNDFTQVLQKMELFCDQYVEREKLLDCLKVSAVELLKKRRENANTMSCLEKMKSKLTSMLNSFEKYQEEINISYKEFEDKLIKQSVPSCSSPRRIAGSLNDK